MEFEFERVRKPFRKRIWFQVLTWVFPLTAAVAFAWLLVKVGVEKTVMTGTSMEPTIADGCELVINKAAYEFGDPKRFDVIVFKQTGKEHSYYNIKRIIGMPGETIVIEDGVVYINGEELAEPIVVPAMRAAGMAKEALTLEENEYFVLGDNRNNSEDSRFANVGCIVREDIVGKAWMTLTPFNFVSKLNRK